MENIYMHAEVQIGGGHHHAGHVDCEPHCFVYEKTFNSIAEAMSAVMELAPDYVDHACRCSVTMKVYGYQPVVQLRFVACEYHAPEIIQRNKGDIDLYLKNER